MLRVLFATMLLLMPTMSTSHAQYAGATAGAVVMMTDNSNSVSGSPGVSLLYTADQETLKAVDVMEIRQIATRTCFHEDFIHRAYNAPLRNILKYVMKEHDLQDLKIKVLQIVRVFSGVNPECAAIWFTYVSE